MAKKKFYAVAAGRAPGIYGDWPTAERQVKGFAGARFKGFLSEEEARLWLEAPQTGGTRAGDRKKPNCAAEPPSAADDDVRVYTDGGCRNNPGPGGYGIIIEMDGERWEHSGGFRRTTNNRMEMTAAIVALQQLAGCSRLIHIYSDSSYLINGLSKGWARGWKKRGWRKSDGSPALNSDLWDLLLNLLEDLQVEFHWVKGHAGHEQNERCDQLAVAASRIGEPAVDEGYEAGAG